MREKCAARMDFSGRLKIGMLLLLSAIGLWLFLGIRTYGAVLYTNPDTDYVVILEDEIGRAHV